jgi:hypothetical protein
MTKYTEEQLQEEIEKATKGLKEKNAELLSDNKKLKDEKKDLAKTAEDLKAEKDEAEQAAAAKSGDIEKLTKSLEAKFQKQIDEALNGKKQSEERLNQILIDKGLTDELIKIKVAPQFLDAAAALIKSKNKVEVSEVDGIPSAVIGGKVIGDFLKEWSQGDNGKNFVQASANGGGGAQGGNTNKSTDDLSKLSPVARLTAARENKSK